MDIKLVHNYHGNSFLLPLLLTIKWAEIKGNENVSRLHKSVSAQELIFVP